MDEKIEILKTSDFNISYSQTKIGQPTSVQHYHDAFEIALFVKANLQIFIKDMKYDIGDGDLLLINEYDIHRIIYNTTTQYVRYVINFKKNYILPLMKVLKVDSLLGWFSTKLYKKVHLNLKDRTELQTLFDYILKASNGNTFQSDEMSQAKVQSNLLLILMRISELLQNGEPQHELNKREKLVQDIVQFIDANYADKIDLDLLESKFFSDKFYISHTFKEITGFTVVEYIQYRRVIEAQKMLRYSSKDIIDIYFDCGFNNVQHFYRVFKKISKVTPEKYRKMRL